MAVPAQTVVALAATATLGATEDETTIVIPVELTIFAVLQAAEEVTSHVTIAPFVKVVVVKVGLLVPAFMPFTFH